MCKHNTNIIHIFKFLCRDTVRYTFGYLIQKELNGFVREWNSHRIRKSNIVEVPPGVPNVLFEFPGLQG